MDIESCCSSVGLNETDSLVIIRSPMCSDNEGCTTESGTSVDGSSRLGSDKFRLSGQFSSYDDSHISDTASEVKRKPAKWCIKPFPNSSSSTDDVIIPMSKQTLTVSIPLHLITLNTSKQLVTNNLLLRDRVTVSRKRMLASSSGEDTNINNGRIRTSISLKLKKSASSNQWHPVTTIDNLPLTDDDLECINNGTTLPLDHRTDSTPLDNTTDSTPLDHRTDSVPLDNTTDSTPLDHRTDSTPLDHTTDSTPLVQYTSSTPLVHKTDSMAEPISMVSSNSSTDDYYYLSDDVSYSTSSTASDFIPCKMSKNNIQTNSNRKPFCFNNVFKSFIPELTISNGQLHPIQSLSVKGICTIPNNHPIKSWKLGRSVDRTTSKKRLKK